MLGGGIRYPPLLGGPTIASISSREDEGNKQIVHDVQQTRQAAERNNGMNTTKVEYSAPSRSFTARMTIITVQQEAIVVLFAPSLRMEASRSLLSFSCQLRFVGKS